MHGPEASSTSHAPTCSCQRASTIVGAETNAAPQSAASGILARPDDDMEFAVTTRTSPSISRGVSMGWSVTAECDRREDAHAQPLRGGRHPP